MRIVLISILFFSFTNLFAQTKIVCLLGGGINQTFATSTSNRIGLSGYTGIGLHIGKETGIQFLPSLLFSINEYRAKVESNTNLLIDQYAIELQFQTSLPVYKQLAIKAGFFTDYIFYDDVKTSYRTQSTLSVGQSKEFPSHSPEEIQAGIIIGGSFSFENWKRISIDVQFKQNVIPIYRQDYVWDSNGKVAFTEKSRPTLLLLGVNIFLGKKNN